MHSKDAQGGSPIPLCKTPPCENIHPFHISQIISKILSCSHEIRGDQVSHKSKKTSLQINISTSSNLVIKLFVPQVRLFV